MASSPGRFRTGWSLLVVGGALAVTGALLRRETGARPEELSRQAQAWQERVAQTLSGAARALEGKAEDSATIPELVAGLDLEADAHTFQDLFESEEWWAPVRTAFPLSSLVTEKGSLARLGPGPRDLTRNPVVLRAREVGRASGFLGAESLVFAIGAAKITKGKHPELAPVVIVGQPLGASVLEQAVEAPPPGGALAISDGSRLLLVAGAKEKTPALLSAVAHEGEKLRLFDAHSAVVAWPLGEGLWTLAAFAPPVSAASPAALPLLVGGAVLTLAALAMLLAAPKKAVTSGGRGAAESVAAPLPPTPQPPVVEDAPPPPKPLGLVRAAPEPAASSSERSTMTLSHARVGASPALAVAPSESFQMGRYSLVQRIGEGGMAEIFFARSHGAEGFVRELVVKRMHPHLARNRLAVNQFIDEARVQSELVHPNIVPVLDFGKAGDEYFLALEFVRGCDLGKVLAAHVEATGESLPLPLAFYVMHEVLEALEFAHTKLGKDGRPLDVVHRDVAPGNVLVSHLGEVKLSDFGIAKSEHRVSFTEIGMVKGNASFMSPEQARGEEVDRRSDIFSAGVVLFYLLTAKLLYRGETTLNQLMRAAVGPATSQFNTLATLPAPAQAILTRALAVDVKERFQSARDFALTLVPFMASRKELMALMAKLFPAGEGV